MQQASRKCTVFLFTMLDLTIRPSVFFFITQDFQILHCFQSFGHAKLIGPPCCDRFFMEVYSSTLPLRFLTGYCSFHVPECAGDGLHSNFPFPGTSPAFLDLSFVRAFVFRRLVERKESFSVSSPQFVTAPIIFFLCCLLMGRLQEYGFW